MKLVIYFVFDLPKRDTLNWSHYLLDPTKLDAGHYLTLFTGHLVHLNSAHLLMNLAGLGMIILLNPKLFLSAKGWLAFFSLCLWTGILIWQLNPEIVRYGGLSGVLHGLFLLAVIYQADASRRWRILLITGIVMKVLAEQSGYYDVTDLGQSIGGEVAIDAHLYGLLGGVLFWSLGQSTGWICRLEKWQKATSNW